MKNVQLWNKKWVAVHDYSAKFHIEVVVSDIDGFPFRLFLSEKQFNRLTKKT